MEEHNRFAGQGSVLLDIGGDIGALIVTAPEAMEGVEIEIRPVGSVHHGHDDGDHHGHHDHRHGDHGDHHHHDHGHSHHPHVAVVARPTAAGPAYTAVFAELAAGEYELYEKLGGPVELTVTVTGGEVQFATWVVSRQPVS